MKRRVVVTQEVTVEIDRKKFNAAFLKEFRESFYNFQTVEEHIRHLAQLYCRGLADNGAFIEGYGKTADMGIRFCESETTDIEVRARKHY